MRAMKTVLTRLRLVPARTFNRTCTLFMGEAEWKYFIYSVMRYSLEVIAGPLKAAGAI